MRIFAAALLVILQLVLVNPKPQTRITGGYNALYGTMPSFVQLEIIFERSTVVCGGVLETATDQIITSASCVNSPFEGEAVDIRLAFGQSNDFSRNKIMIKDVFTPINYDAMNKFSPNDIAVIKMASPVQTSATIAGAEVSTDSGVDAFLDEDLVVCGYGFTSNAKDKTKFLKCTTLEVVPFAECAKVIKDNSPVAPSTPGPTPLPDTTTSAATTTAAATTTSAPTTPSPSPATPVPPQTCPASGSTNANSTAPVETSTTPAPTPGPGPGPTMPGAGGSPASGPPTGPPGNGMICMRNSDSRNACGGDFGVPLFSNKTGTLVAVGVISFFPDVRANAPCEDGHYVVGTQLGSFKAFLSNPKSASTMRSLLSKKL